MSVIKKVVLFIAPSFLKLKLEKLALAKSLVVAYFYDFKRYCKFSGLLGFETEEKLLGKIIAAYHVIEKGLTMPNGRLGFGRAQILTLCADCSSYINLYGNNNGQLVHAVQVLEEYSRVHSLAGFALDSDVNVAVNGVLKKIELIGVCQQRELTKDELFQDAHSAFNLLAKSRSTIRSFSEEEVPKEKIQHALEIACTTPSACNRQTSRTYLYSDKQLIAKILELQGGSRGFGHLTNKLIVVTGEVGVFAYMSERNQVFVDGGIYTMNLLYALHFENVGACVLNCCHSPEKDMQMRNLTGIKESENFICMIACGVPQDRIKVAQSTRFHFADTCTLIG